MNEKPKEILIDKAVELWKRMLVRPKFDNGDKSEQGFMGMMLASMLENNSTQDVLDKFGEELKKTLSTPNEHGYYDSYLTCDYGPCKLLSDAAAKAGLKTQFPWKTDMFIESSYVSLKHGYGAENVYYYPIDGKKWLVTKLRGSDIDKVIDYVTGGKPEFMIEI